MLLVVSCGKESTSSSQPVLTVSVSTLAFGSVRSVDSLTVSNTGGGTLNWSATPGQIWITVNPNQGSLSAGASITVTITIDRDVVPQGGDYSDNVSFTSNGGSATVAVSMHKSVLAATPAQIDFGSAYETRQLTLTNESDDTLNWQGSADESYLGVTPNIGTLYASGSVNLTVSADRILLVDGTHTGNFYFYAGSESLIVPATVEVTPELSLSPPSLAMSSPDTEFVFVGNDGYGTLDWTASYRTDDGGSWLEVFPLAGQCTHTTTDTLTVIVDGTGLAPDDYYGWIVIDDTENGQDSVRVHMSMGEWLYYDDGVFEYMLRLTGPGYLCMRFDNPYQSGGLTVTKISMYVADSPRNIELCGWDVVYGPYQIYWPDNLIHQTPSLAIPSVGWNTFEGLNWAFNDTFFVGYKQLSTDGPYTATDTVGSSDFRSCYGDLIGNWTAVDTFYYAIRVYGVPSTTLLAGGKERREEIALRPSGVKFLPVVELGSTRRELEVAPLR